VAAWITVALAMAVSGAARAEPPRSGVRLDGLQAASPDSTFFRAEGPHEKKAGTNEIGLSLGLDFAEAPLRVVEVDQAGESRDVTKVVERALMLRVGASLSPAYWVWMDVQAPFSLFQQSGIPEGQRVLYAGQSIAASSSSPALGDLRFGLHFRPIDTDSFDLILGGRYWAPVGSIDAYLSDGQPRVEADLGVAGRVGKLLYGCTVSVAPGFFVPRDGDRVAASCGVHGQAMPWLSLGIEPSFALFRDLRDTPSKKDAEGFTYQVEPIVAARFSYQGFSVSLGGGPGFGDAPGAPQGRGMLQLSYQIDGKPPPPPAPPPKPTDPDLDGIPNDRDACPEEAGPDSKDPKQRGCPFLDADGDLIRDDEDACPAQAGVKHPDVKANGCPDTDNDLLPDPVDACRTEPGAAPTGCPAYARLDKRAFVVSPPIQFADGSAQLSKQARAALDEIAATMRANPKLGHVSIQLGTKGASAAISDKRAEAIALVLRAANIDPQRFEVVLQDSMKSGAVEVKLVR
jgi:outer membrane protein OmpA-like peptidoglycan-associated protein